MDFFPEVTLDSFQTEAFARGLFSLAQVDGTHEKELTLIYAFWADAGGTLTALRDLEKRTPITSDELSSALPTIELRKLFFKTALLLAYADGQVTKEERVWLDKQVVSFGLQAEVARLETQVKEYLLSHLSHLANTDAVAKVAHQLSMTK